MLKSVYSFQYSLQPIQELGQILQNISEEAPSSIVHTLNRTQDRKIESLFQAIKNPVSTSAGYWTSYDVNEPKSSIKGKIAIRLKSDLFYSLDPVNLKFQVELSLKNTNRSCLEFLWIEDPDLLQQATPGISFFETWKRSFEALEDLKASGKIKNWGWSIRSLKFTNFIFDEIENSEENLQEWVPKNWIIPFNPFELNFYPFLSDFKRLGIRLWLDRPFSAVIHEQLFSLIPNSKNSLQPLVEGQSIALLNELKNQFQKLESLETQQGNPNNWATQIHQNWVQIPDQDRWNKLWQDQIEPVWIQRKKAETPELTLEYELLFQNISKYFNSLQYEFLMRWMDRWESEWFSASSSLRPVKSEDLQEFLFKLYEKITGVTGLLIEPEFIRLKSEKREPRWGELQISPDECIRRLSQ